MADKSIPEQLDDAEKALPDAEEAEILALQAWEVEEAKARLRLRATHEATGHRQSCADIDAQITIWRSDPEHPVGRAWMTYNTARAKTKRLRADYRSLHRANWKLTKSW